MSSKITVYYTIVHSPTPASAIVYYSVLQYTTLQHVQQYTIVYDRTTLNQHLQQGTIVYDSIRQYTIVYDSIRQYIIQVIARMIWGTHILAKMGENTRLVYYRILQQYVRQYTIVYDRIRSYSNGRLANSIRQLRYSIRY